MPCAAYFIALDRILVCLHGRFIMREERLAADECRRQATCDGDTLTATATFYMANEP